MNKHSEWDQAKETWPQTKKDMETIGGSAEEMHLEDLRKARWYLDREIQNIEKVLAEKQKKHRALYGLITLISP